MNAIKLSLLAILFVAIMSQRVFSETEQVFFDDFETIQGWDADPFSTDDATSGEWERENPQSTFTYGVPMQLGTTVSGNEDLVTEGYGGTAGSNDIDGGKTTIRSPNIDLPADSDITLSFSYYFAHYDNATSDDYLRVKVVGSTTQVVFEELGSADIDEGVWEVCSVSLNDFAGQTISILIEAADEAGGSLVEAGIDDVLIEKTGEALKPPQVSYIPGQSRCESEDFAQINLDDYVYDSDNNDNEISWTSDGQTNLNVSINSSRVATITYPTNWTGEETITFTAEDPDGNTDSDDAKFRVASSTQCGQPPDFWWKEDNGIITNKDDYGVKIRNSYSNFALEVDGYLVLDGNLCMSSEIGMGSGGIYCEYLYAKGYPGYISGNEINGNEINGDIINAADKLVTNKIQPDGELKINGGLNVNGELTAKKVTVTLDGFPDHVFEKDYQLKSLEELEQYINENKHLPGVPSEKEVEKKGLSLGDMQATLLEKIEELTLYLFELKKENKALKEEIKEIKKQ